MTPSDKQIVLSWEDNARAWVDAVREQRIDSREAATNQAIVDRVLALKPTTVMDIGCGEGWLARRLARHGIGVSGFDAVEALVASAREQGGGFFYQFNYDDMASGKISLRADLLVCNFSLLGKEPEARMLAALPAHIRPGGALLIQTVHPATQSDKEEGWREEDWRGFGDGFKTASPWYYRPPAQWQALLNKAGFGSVKMDEVVHPQTGQPLSLILLARP